MSGSQAESAPAESRYCLLAPWMGRPTLHANSRRTPRGVRRWMSEAKREAAMLIGSLLRTAIAVTALLLAQAIGSPSAGAQEAQALAGTVSSAEEGAMEGVIVSAKKDGSNITVSVL